MTVHDALAHAERLLPGVAAPHGAPDARWQAIIAIGEFVEREPDAVWQFVRRWGADDDPDVRAAIATGLLEHLLEHHVGTFLPRVEAEARSNAAFADTVRRCWAFGQAETPVNHARLARLRGLRDTDSSPTIVEASPDDAEAILALQKIAYEREALRYDDWTIPPMIETLDSVRDQIARHVVLKALVDGRLAGSVRGVVTDGVCEVCRLSVHPMEQRRGIGSALIVAIEQRFPDVEAFELFTGNRSVENLRLYDRHGYRHARTKVLSPEVSLIFLRKSRT